MEADSFKSLQGQLLIDGGSLAGSFFNHTVVLVCQHNEEGAFGLVLNRPMGKSVGETILEDLTRFERICEACVLAGSFLAGWLWWSLKKDAYNDSGGGVAAANLTIWGAGILSDPFVPCSEQSF